MVHIYLVAVVQDALPNLLTTDTTPVMLGNPHPLPEGHPVLLSPLALLSHLYHWPPFCTYA